MDFPHHPGSLTTSQHDKITDDSADSGWREADSDQAVGSGTKVSGYIESPVEKRCGTCEYLVGGRFCRQQTVLDDPEVPDGEEGMKLVDAKNGCCSFWEAVEKRAPGRPSPATVDRGNEREREEQRAPK